MTAVHLGVAASLAVLCWVPVAAWADEPVVHAASVTDAIEVATPWVGETSVYAQGLSSLMADKAPQVVQTSTWKPCAGTPESQDRLRILLDKAESDVANLRPAARGALDQAVAAMGCLRDPLDARVASRVYFLRGVDAVRAQNKAEALTSFRQALLFDVGLRWDAAFSPDVKVVFDEAVDTMVGEPQTARLVFAPHPGDGSLWVDGREIALNRDEVVLAAGDHVVQVKRPLEETVDTGRLVVGSSDVAVLVVPAAVTDEVLAWVDMPAQATRLGAVLSTALPAGSRVWIVPEDRTVWSGTVGGEYWRRLDAPERTGNPLLVAGATTTGVGVAGAVAGAALALAARGRVTGWDAPDRAVYDKAASTYALGRVVGVGGLGVAAAGVGLCGAAVAIGGGASVSASPGGVVLHVAR